MRLIIKQVQDLIQLNSSIKTKEEELNQRVIHLESEIKVTNEAVHRLVAELNSHEKELLVMKQNYEIIKIVSFKFHFYLT